MDSLISIKKYILFLSNELNVSLSLHPLAFDPILHSIELITFNIHKNSYCTYIKTNKNALKNCITMQKKVFEKCKSGSFCGTCYAGVKEYVYPISNGKETVAFISVSGYRADNVKAIHGRLAQEFGFDIKVLERNYDQLKEDTVSREYLDVLIKPLLDMLELAYIKEVVTPNEKCFAEKVANYIRSVRNQPISSETICRKFNCSRSYLSTQFNKHYNKTLPEYITDLRMEDAKELLSSSSLSITEIAFSVGFTDSNYFSNLFKKLYRISPSAYRRSVQNQRN